MNEENKKICLSNSFSGVSLGVDDIDDNNMSSAATLVQPGVYHAQHNSLRPGKKIKRKYMRAVFKSGEFNVSHTASNGRKTFSNYFHLLVETRWRWTLLNFCTAFTCVWLFFAVIYWIVSFNHDDFSEEHLPQHINETDFIPCINNIYGFTSAFLFSIEVHTTVAYGQRAITLECPETIIAMCLQCIISSIFQAIMVGILFAKLTRPRARTLTILYSKHAVINVRNDKFCLIFRIGDMRKSRILNIRAKAYLIRFHNGCDALDSSEQIELKVGIDECESTFFLWPVTAVHVIDERSPFYGFSAADLLCSKLEILVVFEGIIESTGQPVQARSSFTEYDILWGHRFVPMVGFNVERMMYNVDFSKLSDVVQVDTPLCSASEYNSLLAIFSENMTDSSSYDYSIRDVKDNNNYCDEKNKDVG